MVVHETELVVSCCGNSDGESFLVSFCFINTRMQKHITRLTRDPRLHPKGVQNYCSLCQNRIYVN